MNTLSNMPSVKENLFQLYAVILFNSMSPELQQEAMELHDQHLNVPELSPIDSLLALRLLIRQDADQSQHRTELSLDQFLHNFQEPLTEKFREYILKEDL